jgi:peptidoglycan/LPS O-acetylase OafA/YrhL
LGIFSISVHETHSVPALAALLLSLAGTSILAVILAYAMYHLVEAPAKRVLRSTLRTSSPTAAKMALLTGRGEAA